MASWVALSWEKFKSLSSLQLDIVGIVAILGEGSTTRNAQASALGWHHVLPRLLPAPQALLEHEHKKRLPTVPGTVVGAYSGNVKFELNFFCQLLHEDNLERNQVELVVVSHREEPESIAPQARLKKWFREKNVPGDWSETDDDDESPRKPKLKRIEQAYNVKRFGPLTFLSVLGCFVSVGMIVGSVRTGDGPALLATICLSVTSSVVGFASWWWLDFREDPQKATPQAQRVATIPDSDVVIFYPRQGAFRIVRCSETISRLYFRTENCIHVFGDDAYRVLALIASIFLMVGLLSMSNAQTSMQIAFAASYIVLNALYWGFSALNPTGRWGHWKHKYKCVVIPVKMPPAALMSKSTTRSDTQESMRNRPVTTQDPISPVEVVEEELPFSQSPIETSRRPSADLSQVPAYEKTGSPTMRKRKTVTFYEKTGSAAAEVTHDGSRSTPSNNQAPSTLKSARQNTKDLEGGRERPIKPFGSLWDRIMGWLVDRNLINERPHRESRATAKKADTFTTALWKAIALTGSTRWLRETHIAPDNQVWKSWLAEAAKRAAPYVSPDKKKRVSACNVDELGNIVPPVWDHQGALTDLFAKEEDAQKRRPPEARRLHEVVTIEVQRRRKVKGISADIERRLKALAHDARVRAKTRRRRRASVAVPTIRAPEAQTHQSLHRHLSHS